MNKEDKRMTPMEEAVLKHSMLLENQERISEELRVGVISINRKLEDFAQVFTTQNELMTRLINLEKQHQDSINRVHKRVDDNEDRIKAIEQNQSRDGCPSLLLRESKFETKFIEIVENTKSNQKRIDKIEGYNKTLVLMVLVAVIGAVLKLVIL